MRDTATSGNPRGARRTHATTVALHWLAVVAVFVSLSTGLRISADGVDADWARTLNAIQLQGDVMRWHVGSALALTAVAVAYVAFLIQARLAARVAVDRARIGAFRSPDSHMRWSAVNVFVYWLAFLLVAGAAITGILLYFFSGQLPHEAVIAVHRAIAWLFIGYLVAHVVVQFAAGGVRGLLKILSPRAAYGAATAFALGVAGVSAATLLVVDKAAIREVVVPVVTTPPEMDGDTGDAAWSGVEPTLIPTMRGVNQPGGEVTVQVRAVRDDSRLYALFEWPDSTRSQKHLPLVKGKNGWTVVQKEFGIQDEDDYYEDKFAVMLARSPRLAGAGSIHLGPRPLKHRPGPAGGRGLHYTEDGSIVDVWHWKSVRTGSTAMNQSTLR